MSSLNHHHFGASWAAKEDTTLLTLQASGLRYREISDLMPGRTEAAVKGRYRLIGLTPEARAAAAIKKATPSISVRGKREQSVTRAVVPPEVLEERNRRQAAVNTLTGVLMGDPPAGFSARERRA